jgi:hypothetical protein
MNVATGATAGAVLSYYKSVQIIANSGGAGTVTVPAPTPAAGSIQVGKFIEIEFWNSASGAVTWSLNGTYAVNTAIDTTDGHRTSIGFRWDGFHWRERYRAQT